MTTKNLKKPSLKSLDQELPVAISNVKHDIEGYIHGIKLSFAVKPSKRFYLEARYKFNI